MPILYVGSSTDDTKSKRKKKIMSCDEINLSASTLSKKALSHKLEITAISAEDLVDGKNRVKKNVYVAFDIVGDHWNRPMRTSVDEVGGNHPTWEEKLETEFPSETEPGLMYVRVYCRVSGRDKHVGTARVPVKVFTGEYAPEGFMHCLSYRLWDDYGRKNGIVNFSARILPAHKGGGARPFWLR